MSLNRIVSGPHYLFSLTLLFALFINSVFTFSPKLPTSIRMSHSLVRFTSRASSLLLANSSRSRRFNSFSSKIRHSPEGSSVQRARFFYSSNHVQVDGSSHHSAQPAGIQRKAGYSLDLVIERLDNTLKLLAKPQTTENQSEIVSPETAKDLVRSLMDYFLEHKRLSPELTETVLDLAIAQQKTLPNVVSVSRPIFNHHGSTSHPSRGSVTVVGDTHGQFVDAVYAVFSDNLAGLPCSKSGNIFVFNGDIVDRGPMSVEIALTLAAMSVLMPGTMFVLRGNHETTSMNQRYGFEKEVLRKYNQSSSRILRKFRDYFAALPVAAVIEETVFVTHGGLGPKTANMTIAEMNKIDRFDDFESFEDHPILELLWADPRDHVKEFAPNHGRGGGLYFGSAVTERFLAKNNLQCLIRSHEVEDDGFAQYHGGKVVTVFSAPNYCGSVGNKAAIVRFGGEYEQLQGRVIQFVSAPPREARPSSPHD